MCRHYREQAKVEILVLGWPLYMAALLDSAVDSRKGCQPEQAFPLLVKKQLQNISTDRWTLWFPVPQF